ncbi:MAG: hypothetical protein PWQ67_850 [Clostridia bacterium]|jgi:hypothetical protein|nr:hypothetical protein [Clostridia bacterium]MDN5322396.1 hypothetical protein [Clostridia bacterium]
MEEQREGVFNRHIFSIKNKKNVWVLKIIENKLWGKYSWDAGCTWLDWQELISDYNGLFSFTISDENKLHIVCKNNNENIQYCCWQGQKITVDLLDHKWISQEKINQQKILIDSKGNVNLFIFTEKLSGDFWKIKYCFKSDGLWSPPEEIDYGLGSNLNQGAVALDLEGTIYLIYEVFKNGYYQLIYRKKHFSLNQWSEKIPITASLGINLNPYLIIDKKGTMHLTWVRSEGMNLRVLYRRKLRTTGAWMVSGWQKEQYLSEPKDYCYSPVVNIIENRVEVYWQQREGIFQSISNDSGLNFSEPFLKERYQDLAKYEHILLDTDKIPYFNQTTFDPGSTSAYLAISEFAGIEMVEDNKVSNTQKKEENSESNSSMSNLKLNEAWQELHKYLEKINGNFRRLLFEMDEIKMIDALKETIEEKTKHIEQLKMEIFEKEQQILKQKEKEQSLEKIIQKLKDSLLEKNKEQITKKKFYEEELKTFQQENEKLKQSLETIQNLNEELRRKLAEKGAIISQLEKKEAEFKQQLQNMRNTPFPLFRKRL